MHSHMHTQKQTHTHRHMYTYSHRHALRHAHSYIDTDTDTYSQAHIHTHAHTEGGILLLRPIHIHRDVSLYSHFSNCPSLPSNFHIHKFGLLSSMTNDIQWSLQLPVWTTRLILVTHCRACLWLVLDSLPEWLFFCHSSHHILRWPYTIWLVSVCWPHSLDLHFPLFQPSRLVHGPSILGPFLDTSILAGS